jgi:predicted alpha/beta-hydrolase family hydrolase
MAADARDITDFRFPISGTSLQVSGALTVPRDARALYAIAHGAGAGMNHPFLIGLAAGLATAGIASIRYQFPYMEAGRRRPDPPHLLEASIRSAVAVARERCGGLPLVAGGKSMGGRMTSAAAAKEKLSGVQGLIFLGFPLHPPGKPGIERANHLDSVDLPMLFLQGTRDSFARPELMLPVCDSLGSRARLHVVEGGDHSFKVLKRSGRTDTDVMQELVTAISEWVDGVLERSAV